MKVSGQCGGHFHHRGATGGTFNGLVGQFKAIMSMLT